MMAWAAAALLAAAALTDVAERRIPNRLVAALALLALARIGLDIAAGASAPGAAGAAALAALGDVAAAVAVFCAGAVLFHLRLLGGGDVKLLAAAALLLGAAALPTLLLATALAGGLLAAVYLVLAVTVGWGARRGIPYGLAIAAGAIATGLGPI